MDLHRHLRNPFEVRGVWRNHDVHVLCSSNYSPGIDRETADGNELDTSLRESAQQLIEGRLGQLERLRR
jgi:hypothetical protein